MQLPNIIRTAIKAGNVAVNGAGHGAWDAVHIEDLVLLYELLLAKVLAGDDIPSGKRGVYFAETGDYTWLQLSQGLADELAKQGVLKSNEVKHLSLQEAADLWSRGNVQIAELGFASKRVFPFRRFHWMLLTIRISSRSRADLSRKLGWKPMRTRGDFFDSFKDEVATIAAEFK